MVTLFDFEEMKNKIKNLPPSFVFITSKNGLRINDIDLFGTVIVLRSICAEMVYGSLIQVTWFPHIEEFEIFFQTMDTF